MAAPANDLLHGTLDALVLKTLSWGPRHGYAVARWLEETTGDALRIEEGSLYPALYRMTQKRWIKGAWGVSENNRRARYYSLTVAGRSVLEEQTTQWLQYADTLRGILTVAPRKA